MKVHPLSIAALFLWPLLPACRPSSAAAASQTEAPDVAHARAVLLPVGGSGVSGDVRFEETEGGVRVTGRVEGLTPGEHGFHVHTYGDVSDRETGASAGGHFAPDGNPHGRPTDHRRHVGDLGNIEAGAEGIATIDLVDDVIALHGPHSILGRAVVVHAKADDFSQPSGNAGKRVALGVIGIAPPERESE